MPVFQPFGCEARKETRRPRTEIHGIPRRRIYPSVLQPCLGRFMYSSSVMRHLCTS